MAIVLPAWIFASFVLAQVVMYLIVQGLLAIGVPLVELNPTVLTASYNAVTYALMVAMVISLPWWIKKYKTTKEELGIQAPGWELAIWELLIAPASLIAYVILSALLVIFAQYFLPFIDFNQVQDTGFSQLIHGYEYVLAFLTLVVIAPIAEEVLFRGYLLGKLRAHISTWLSVLIVSVLFAIVHGAWNVGIDVFALSIVLCLLRIFTKNLWPSIILHMTKNFIAFYLLFINPTLLSTLGG